MSALFFSWESRPVRCIREHTTRGDTLCGTRRRCCGRTTDTPNLPLQDSHAWKNSTTGDGWRWKDHSPTPNKHPATPHNNTNYERFNRNKNNSTSKMHYYRCCWQSYGHLLQTRGLGILSCFYHAGGTPDWEIHNW